MEEHNGARRRSETVPLGFVFLGQFIDHDITLDVTSSLDAVNDPDATQNFRTPALDLDCVYGSGPEASPFLYEDTGPFKGIKLTGKKGKVVAAFMVGLEDEIVAVSNNGITIRMEVREISSQGRDATGVRIMNLDDGDIVGSVAPILATDQD